MAYSLNLAAIQMISGPHVADNLIAAEKLIAHAADGGAQLIVLPEFFPCIGLRDEARLMVAEDNGVGPIQEFLVHQAKERNLWIVGGSIPLKSPSPNKIRNTCLVFNPAGQCVATYDKIHLFNFYDEKESWQEQRTTQAGNDLVRFEAPCGSVAVGVCYDLRFPELFRALGSVNLIVLPAAFTVPTGRAHWELLLRTRAVENQCYVVAAAQGGEHPGGRHTFGHSMIVDPWGEVLQQLPSGEGVVHATLHEERLTEVRSMLPALINRRRDLFTFLP